jgi:hypothetical protein
MYQGNKLIYILLKKSPYGCYELKYIVVVVIVVVGEEILVAVVK